MKKIKKLRDNLEIPLVKANKIYEMAKEKKAYSKMCEEESSDEEMRMNPTMRAVVKNMRERLSTNVKAQLIKRLGNKGANLTPTNKIDINELNLTEN